MTLAELRGHLRVSLLRDSSLPYLWTDDELTLYLNDAETQFARRTHCLIDELSDFTTVVTEQSQATYALDDRIIRVEEALDQADDNLFVLLQGTRGQIPRTLHEGRPTHFTVQHAVDTDEALSPPQGVGRQRHVLRFYPVPDAEYIIDLRVVRKPLCPMEADTDEPEIDEDYHLLLCDYACWKALTNNRPEGAQMADPRPFMESWERGVRDAKRNVALLRAGPAPRAESNWTGKVTR